MSRDISKILFNFTKTSGRNANKSHKGCPIAVKSAIGDSIKSGGVCPICNKIIQFGRVAFRSGEDAFISYDDQCPSLDRINCSKDYVKGNIRVTHRRCNSLRRDRPIDFYYENENWNPSDTEISIVKKENDEILKNNFEVEISNLITIKSTNTYMSSNTTLFSTTITENSSIEEIDAAIIKLKAIVEERSKIKAHREEAEKFAIGLGYTSFIDYLKSTGLLTEQIKSTARPYSSYSLAPKTAELAYNALISAGAKFDEIIRTSDERFWNKATKLYSPKCKVSNFKDIICRAISLKLIPVTRTSKGVYKIDTPIS